MTQYFYVGRKNLNACGIAISRLRSFAGGLKLLLVCGCLLVVWSFAGGLWSFAGGL